MSVKKLEGGRYKVEIRPQGAAGRRIQRVFDNKADGRAFEKHVQANYHNKEWLARPADNRRLADLIAVGWHIPKGQAVHILRHTFAAHFMMNGGNILTLQKILDHANIQQTMTYAHLASDYLQDATKLNPLRDGIHILSISVDFKGVP